MAKHDLSVVVEHDVTVTDVAVAVLEELGLDVVEQLDLEVVTVVVELGLHCISSSQTVCIFVPRVE